MCVRVYVYIYIFERWLVCVAADWGEDSKKRGGGWRGGAEHSYLWTVWTKRQDAAAPGVRALWLGVRLQSVTEASQDLWCLVAGPVSVVAEGWWTAVKVWIFFKNWCLYVFKLHAVVKVFNPRRGKPSCFRYHTHCLRPSLNTRPEGEWICPECAVAHQITGDYAVSWLVAFHPTTKKL